MMNKKKWQRSPGIKGLLLVLQYILLGGAIFVGLFFLTLEFHGVRLGDSGGDYLDSSMFVSNFYSATWNVAHAISTVAPYGDAGLTTAGNDTDRTADNSDSSTSSTRKVSSEDTHVVDLDEVVNDQEISFTNTSGLAYSLEELRNWAKEQDYDYDSANGDPIVICHYAKDASDNALGLTYHYYYVDDFLKLIDSGELAFAVNMESYMPQSDDWDTYQESSYEESSNEIAQAIIDEVKDDLQYGSLTEPFSEIRVNSKDGSTLYDYFYSYEGYEPKEHFTPVGADSILDVVNENERWNGHLQDAFNGLYDILSSIDNYNEQMDVLNGYAQGQSNMSYLYVNEDNGQVLTNDSDLEKELNYEKDKNVTFSDSADASANTATDFSMVGSRNSNTGSASGAGTNYYQKLCDILDGMDRFSYVLLQAAPDSFSTNLSGLDRHYALPGNHITSTHWKEIMRQVLPEVSDNFIFVTYVNQELPVSDSFTDGKTFFDAYSRYQRPVFLAFLLCFLLLIVSLVWLTAVSGRKSTDEEIHLCFFDRWPTELSAGLVVFAWLLVIALFLQGSTILNLADYQIARLQAADAQGSLLNAYQLLVLIIIGFYTLFWFQIGYLSLVRRIKAKQLWKNSLLRRLLLLIVKVIRYIKRKFHALADFYSRNTVSRLKVTFAFFGYMLIKYFIFGSTKFFFFLSCLADLLLLIYGITKAYHREQITKGLKEISGGNLQYKIPLDRLSGDDKRIAEYINNIGSGLDAAVENSVKNERMKTELITNVSHDLKTPLTSIISYIDLLKRENFSDSKVLEYLDILETKAARLKVLTEDVVEASKASTGNLTLNMTNLDFVEMLHQVIGEFEERFEERQLTMMVHFPDEPSMIRADGQRLWRVLENVFGNVTKYAMESTRVYAEVKNARGQVIFTLKNISAQPLNFAAEELTERFVRGDVSRNTEGSGLGLSIAKSLTELQGGKFQLYLDGDLFKVTITFQAQAEIAEQPEPALPEQPKPEER